MAKEPVDFVFKANTSDIDKAFKKIADEFDKLGKGTKIKLDGIDTKSMIDAVKLAQAELQKLGNTSSLIGAQAAIQSIADSLTVLESSLESLDFSKPFKEILPAIDQISDSLKKIVDESQILDSLKLSTEIPVDSFDGVVHALDSITDEIGKFTTALSNLPTDSMATISRAAQSASESLDVVSESAEAVVEHLEDIVNAFEEADDVCTTLREQIESTNEAILSNVESIQAFEDACKGIDPVLIDTDTLSKQLEEQKFQAAEFREIFEQEIPLYWDEEQLKAHQQALAEAAERYRILQQEIKNTEKQLEECAKAIEKFGDIQSKIDATTRSLREFGSLTGVDLGPLEDSLGKLSQTIGYLPVVTTAAGKGFFGMGTAAVGAIKSATAAMMANPILAILVAITAALVAGIALWSAWSKARLAANENSAKLANTLERQNKALREADLDALKKRFDMQRKQEIELQNLRLKNMRDLNEAILDMNAVQTQLVQERHRLEMDALRSRHEFEQMMLDVTAKNTKQQTGIDAEKTKIEQRGEIEWRRDYETGRKQHFFKDTGEKVSDALGGDQDFGIYSSGASNSQQKKGREIGFRTAYVQQAADNIKRIQLKMLEDEQQVSDRKIAIWEREQQRFLEMNLTMSESENERVSKSIESISGLEGELEKLRRIQAEAEFGPSKIRTWQGRHIAEVTDAQGQVKAVDLGKWSKDDTNAQAELKRIVEEINAEVAERLEKTEAELANTRKLHDEELKRLAVATEYRRTIDAISSSSKGIIDRATSDEDGINLISLQRDLALQRQLAENAAQVANFTGNDDDKAKLHEKHAWQMDMMKRQYAAAGRHEQTLFDTRLSHLKAYREFEMETWTKNMDSTRKLAKQRVDHELGLRSMQRQSASKMLDMKLDLEIARGDTYGKSRLEQKREQRDIRDRYGDEQSRQDLKRDEKKAQLKADEEALQERRMAEDKLQRKQIAERQQLEMELLNEKAKKEGEWIQKEFAMRRELIAQEMEYKEMLERQMREKADGNDTSGHEQQRSEMNKRHAEKLQQYDTSQERARFAADQKHRMDALETRQGNESTNLSHELDVKKARRDSDIENAFQDRTDQLERAIRKRDAAKKRRDDLQDRLNQFMQDEDNAVYARRSEQRGLDKTLRTNLIGSTSGTDRMKAMDDYRRDSHLLAQKSQIEADTRVEIEQAKERGADERELNQIQKNSEEMIAHLQDQNDISKAMRDKFMDGSGGLRGLIQKESGTTEDMMGAWERIQQSAFNHISDPAADAVIEMDRNEALRYAQQMNFYKEWFPKMAKANTGLAPD